MSSYDSSTTSFTTVVRPTQAELVRTALRPHLTSQIEGWVGSRDLLAIADRTSSLTRGRNADLGAIARATRASITERPLAEALLRTAEPALLARADAELDRLAAHTARGDRELANRSADAATAALDEALHAVGRRLRVEERTLTVEAAQRSLATLGFQVAASDGQRSTGIWGLRGDQAVAILVRDGGAIETDVVGCAGDTCEPLMEEFREQMAAEGAVLTVAVRQPHGDDRGGALIVRARQASADGTMAEGIVEQFERPATRSRRRTGPAPTGTRTVAQAREAN